MQGETGRVEKQERIENSLRTLRNVTDHLFDLVDRLESNNGKLKEAKDAAKEPRMPLAAFLENLPEMIDTQGKRLEEGIAKITNMLY